MGQLIFSLYVVVLYAPLTLSGKLEGWNRVLPHGYVPGDAAGNAAVGLHLLWALLVLVTGCVQLIPWIRRRWPVLHRWSGRVYVVSALGASVAGLIMVWTRGTVGGMVQHVSISINAVLIILCAIMAWRHARARRFAEHRGWALRLFLVASGVWFFRVGLMLWLVIHRAPVGFDPKTFTGPFLTFLTFAQYLLPLACLEIYLRAQRGGSTVVRYGVAGALTVLTILTASGIAAATLGMWLPRVR
ncbi:MAG: DUF2306 domain-containing protein [Bryobacteraceae bacterium]|nr:DUF2306 domain-containing protein [Bryobacteraceae bacterium]